MGSSESSAGFDRLEARYVIAWLAHIGNAKAAIRNDMIHVVPDSGGEQGDPLFDCFKEVDGSWRNALIRRINSKDGIVSLTLDDVEVYDVLRMMMRISGFGILITPEMLKDSTALSTRWTGKLEDTTCTNILDSVARKGGFAWRFQGGLILLTTNTEATAEQQYYDTDNRAALYLKGSTIESLSCLKGAVFTDLMLAHTKITDISPLKETSIARLNLSDTTVTNLSPLKGMTIETLTLSRTPIQDLWQVRDISTRTLCLDGTKISDLSPLKGMQLTSLSLDDTKVTDLGPLRDIPLSMLSFSRTQVSDLRTLGEMDLEYVNFTPARIKFGIEILREMKTLKYINQLDSTEFWRRYDAGEFQKEKVDPNTAPQQ